MLLESLKCLLFGITVGLAIGPMAILIMQKAISYGFKIAAMSAIAIALADGSYGLVAFIASNNIIHPLINNKVLVNDISSMILVIFGICLIHQAIKNRKLSHDGEMIAVKSSHHFLSSYCLTIASPFTLVLFIGFAGRSNMHTSLLSSLILALMVFLGSAIVQLLLAVAGAVIGNIAKYANLSLYLNLLSGCLVAAIGLSHII